jgi:hypothetical protein
LGASPFNVEACLLGLRQAFRTGPMRSCSQGARRWRCICWRRRVSRSTRTSCACGALRPREDSEIPLFPTMPSCAARWCYFGLGRALNASKRLTSPILLGHRRRGYALAQTKPAASIVRLKRHACVVPKTHHTHIDCRVRLRDPTPQWTGPPSRASKGTQRQAFCLRVITSRTYPGTGLLSPLPRSRYWQFRPDVRAIRNVQIALG